MVEEIGVTTGGATVVAPIVIEPESHTMKKAVAGETSIFNTSIVSNSQKEHKLIYNLTYGTESESGEKITEMPATFEAFINGQAYTHGAEVILRPLGKHEMLIKMSILPNCPLGIILTFECRVVKVEEEESAD